MASSSGLSISGVGSGLDIQGIVSQLVQAEGAPRRNLLASREASYEATLSGLSKLKSAASELSSAAFDLRSLDTFRSRAVTSSNEDILTATASPGTALGKYQVEVGQLATAQKQASAGFADSTATVGSGQLTFDTSSSSFSVAVAAGDSLATIRDKINGASGNDSVQASILNVDDGAGGTEARLVFSARETGTANAVTVTATDDDGNNTDAAGLSRLASANLTELTAAQDAQVTIDGLSVTSSTNQVDGVIEGMTLNLNQAQPGTKVEVAVEGDNGPVLEALNSFVEKYNALNSTYRNLTAYNAETEQGGVLQGDATANGINRGLRSLLGGNIGTGTIDNLAEIGIQIDSEGKMTLDEATAEEALNSDSQAVKDFLTDPTNGLSQQVDELLQPYLSFDGIIDNRTDSLNRSIDRIEDQRAALDRRMENYRDSLTTQFTAMDKIVQNMQSSASYLSRIGINVGS
ncbi:flagellar filament capping protein FliD [Guyparkeria halophila]|uniref:Flagellar hook-associated protein 2 n=1 Tax=Guyparkeria halophila TaxID=47960 RepID=A0A6I6CUB7_9GAMM|nr:flagellar filament capping protein FliD [Guyparkeria halophila]QGT78046.1 flagellar filament capping protein FliD [Guyparkeria halophila]